MPVSLLFSQYRHRKKVSASIFRYIIYANDKQSEDLGLDVAADVRDMWRLRIDTRPQLKLDDVGDAMMHAVTEVVCSPSSYRQLMPSNVSLHCNRTVTVTVKPDYTYYVVLHCTWNGFELESLGIFPSNINTTYFNSPQAVSDIKTQLLTKLSTALTDVTGGDVYKQADHIKVIVKQLKGYMELKQEMAGSLTMSTVAALRQIIDRAAGPTSQLCQRKDKVLGSLYIRTDPSTGYKFQVICSAGKHTNAIVTCMNWMTENARDFVDLRTHGVPEKTKIAFFDALQQVASSDSPTLDLVHISQNARDVFRTSALSWDDEVKGLLAGLALIAINKNQPLVKSVAANYRRSTRRNVPKATNAEQPATDDK